MKTIEELEAELETIKRERDKLAILVELSDGYRRERDEARAEIARLRQRLQFDTGGSDKIDELEDALMYVRDAAIEAYRRGAEAMRERCASAMHPIIRSMISRTDAAQTIRALPIPGEP